MVIAFKPYHIHSNNRMDHTRLIKNYLKENAVKKKK